MIIRERTCCPMRKLGLCPTTTTQPGWNLVNGVGESLHVVGVTTPLALGCLSASLMGQLVKRTLVPIRYRTRCLADKTHNRSGDGSSGSRRVTLLESTLAAGVRMPTSPRLLHAVITMRLRVVGRRWSATLSTHRILS